MFNHIKKKDLGQTARSAGILMFLGLVCASIFVALVLTVQMVFELLL